MKLPGGFSPKRFVQQAGSYINPTGGTADYDVFSDYSARGGYQSPSSGAFFGGGPTTTTGLSTGETLNTGTPEPMDPNASYGTTDTSGGTSGGGSTYEDQQAAEQQSFLDMLPGAISNIGQNAQGAFGTVGRNLRGTAEGLYNTVNQGQRAIDRSRENVELNRINSMKDILSFVRNGLRQGGARLANMNAGESSAVGELGRAYSSLGNERARGVGNQAVLQGREIDTQQEGLDLQKGQGQTDFNRVRDEQVATIGNQVRNQLAALDAQGQGLGITGRIAVDQEKQRIIDEGLAALNEVDAWLQSQLGGVRPQDVNLTRTNALALQQAGTAGVNPFEFGEAPEQRIQGPSIDFLPLFTRNKRTETA